MKRPAARRTGGPKRFPRGAALRTFKRIGAMTMSELYGLILTGGSGTRLWPRSREDLPKQFLAL